MEQENIDICGHECKVFKLGPYYQIALTSGMELGFSTDREDAISQAQSTIIGWAENNHMLIAQMV